MRYALLIHERPGAHGFDDGERAAISAEYLALHDDDRVLVGERLAPAETATTVRVEAGELLLTDGPFADTEEIFGGYYLVETSDLDHPASRAGRRPAARPARCGESGAIGGRRRSDRWHTRSH